MRYQHAPHAGIAQMTDISWTVHIMNLLGAMSLLALIDHTIVRAVVANAGKLGEVCHAQGPYTHRATV